MASIPIYKFVYNCCVSHVTSGLNQDTMTEMKSCVLGETGCLKASAKTKTNKCLSK